MANEARVAIQALREGKAEAQAWEEYCWARLVVAIDGIDLEHGADPFECPRYSPKLPTAMAVEAIGKGADDKAAIDAFEKGVDIECQRGMWFREMRDHERPTPGQLLRAMTKEERAIAVDLLGPEYVATCFAKGAGRLTI